MTLAACLPLILSFFGFVASDQDKTPKFEPRHKGLLFHAITALALDPSSELLFAATEHGQLAAWDLKQDVFRWEFTPDGASARVTNLCAGPELLTYVTTGGGAVGVVSAATGKDHRILILGKMSSTTSALAHDPGGKWIWAGMKDGTLFRGKSGADITLYPAKLENGGITAMALDSDAQQLAVGGEDGTIRFLNARTGAVDDEKVIKAHKGPVTVIAWTRGDTAVISGSNDGAVRGWRPANKNRAFAIDSLRGAVTCLAIDPTGKLLAWGDDQGVVHVWDLSKQKTLAELTDDPTGSVNALVFFDKGRSLAGAMGQKHITLWDLSKLTK